MLENMDFEGKSVVCTFDGGKTTFVLEDVSGFGCSPACSGTKVFGRLREPFKRDDGIIVPAGEHVQVRRGNVIAVA